MDGQAYLESRGLDMEVVVKAGVTWTSSEVRFNYIEGEKTKYAKVRTIHKKMFWTEPDKQSPILFNIDCLPTPRGISIPGPLFITEGEIDCLSVMQALPGCYCVSLPNGAGSLDTVWVTGADGAKVINPVIQQFQKIILVSDDDDAGRGMRDGLTLCLGDLRCWYVSWPKGCNDANEVLIAHGVDALERHLTTALPMKTGTMMGPFEMPPPPARIAHETGWSGLSQHLKIVAPEFMVVTGVPGSGKSLWVRALVLRMAMLHGWRSTMFSGEDHLSVIRRDTKRFATRVADIAEKDVESWVDRHVLLCNPADGQRLTIDYIKTEMFSAAMHFGCRMFVIDPWNDLEKDMGKGDTETLYTERALNELKRCSRHYRMVLIIVAHPKKIDGVPSLYDISGSANWKNKCDHGIIVHREEGSTITEIIVEKSKDHEVMGKPGSHRMSFKILNADYLSV
jgi:twinkle protein